MAGDPLGVYPLLREQLVPDDVDFAHAGLSTLRVGSRRPSPDQCVAPCRNVDPAVSGAPTDDGVPVAQRLRGRRVRDSPAARGIGRLGVRAQRRAQWAVLHADARGVCAVCPCRVLTGPLSDGRARLRHRADVQTDAGDAAVCIVAAGLLAVETHVANGSPPCARCAPPAGR